MNILNIFREIAKVDPEIYDRVDNRRSVFKHMSGFGSKVALAAVPLALSSVFKKAYGQNTSGVVGVLQFALTLEHLEAEFYKAALNSSGLIPTGAPMGAITKIRDHEIAHVTLLQQTITQLNATPNPMPNFDLTGGNGSGNGPYADAFSNYAKFLTVAQALEDTGVRAYKGQAANLISNDTVLQAALQIHSVEARHAAHIRLMRAGMSSTPDNGNLKPWITLTQAHGAPQSVYEGEGVTTQAGVDIMTNTDPDITAATASEAFDEPLTMAQVQAIVDPFIA
ncbi:ferritin-like domain-containing protein [Rufibacter roseus]|uniref:Ferritin-like domain-containing protein n=1 Tax=Rufibacter roseus TaxID=1567108 RepID=A0ABW2DNY0_9BACT|nr:ferritin-like domain-containing protein [Rufibacter roseus]